MHMLYDICSGAGIGADGYAAIFGRDALRGFDKYAQPHYPYKFEIADALALLRSSRPEEATALHTSFPCQFATTAGHLRDAQGGASKFGDLLTPGLALLRKRWAHKPWVVENVDDNRGRVRAILAPRPGEHLLMLCGSMFGLAVQRHRLFLANFPLTVPEPTGRGKYRGMGCRHETFPIGPKGRPKPVGVYHVPGDRIPSGGHTARDAEHGRQVMGVERPVPWASLKEGFPPAYTRWVGADLAAYLEEQLS